MRRRRHAFRRIVLSCCVAIVAVSTTAAVMEIGQEDREYLEFYNTGRTVANFLASYCKALEAAHAVGQPGPVLEHYSQGYLTPARGHLTWSQEQFEGNVSVFRLTTEGGEDFGRAEVAREIDLYLDTVHGIEHTACKIDVIEERHDTGSERRVELTVKFILDGIDDEARRFQDRHFYRFKLVDEAGVGAVYDWKIAASQLVEGVRVAGHGTDFLDADPQELGIDFKHRRDPRLDMKKYRSELKFGVMQHVSGGISAADYNQDGRSDLLFLDGRRLRLYANQGATSETAVSFVDRTAAAGLEGLGQSHVGLFADFDNDGDRDLFVGRYLETNLYMRNNGDGTFSDASREMGIDAVLPTASATLLDYDRDGYLDLYLALYGNALEAHPRLPFLAQNAPANRLYRNVGGRRFEDVTRSSGTGDTGWSLAVAAGDYDGDGWPDLAVANDFGRKSLYRNSASGTFTEVAKEAGVLDFSGGMGLAFGDFDDDGRLDLYTSNIHSNQRWLGAEIAVTQYLRGVLRSRWALTDALEYLDLYRLVGSDWVGMSRQIGEGNSLFRNLGDGTFRELRDSHTRRAGWGWGVAFFDLENDTDLDLYAANGWISNTPNTDL